MREERDVEWSAHPPQRTWSALLRATMQSPAYGFPRLPTFQVVYDAYGPQDVQSYPDEDATSAPCCYSFTHDTNGYQPSMNAEGRIESVVQPG